MTALIKQLWNDESGATAVEYGLMVALIAVAIIAGVTALGGRLNTLFTQVSNKMPQTVQ
jgi:pilus assembly protein Flp/PilA